MAVAFVLAGCLAGVLVFTLLGIPWMLAFRQRQAAIGERKRRREEARA